MASKIILAAILILGMSGCSTTPKPEVVTRIETVTVYKPVFRVPDELKKFPTLQRPDLPTNYLTNDDKDNPGHVAKVVVESMAILREYAEALEDQIAAYKKAIVDAEHQSDGDTIPSITLLQD